MTLERDIQAKILRWLRREPDITAEPVVGAGTGTRGFPDIFGSVGDRALYLEVKRPGEKPTKLQAAIHAKIGRRGSRVFVVHDLDDVREAVAYLRDAR